MFLRGVTQSRLSIRYYTHDFRVVLRIIAIGLPSLLRQAMSSLATIILNRCARVYGDAAVAAMAIVNRISMFIFSVGLGLGQGYQPVCSFNYGAGKYSRVRAAFRATLRLTLVTGNAPGNDMRFYWEQIEASRNFANKIWNASRFIMMNLPEEEIGVPEKFSAADRWILSAMNTLIRDVQENMDRYELGIAVQKVHDFLWDEFCDWYIEIAKLRLAKKDEDPEAAKAALYTLKEVLGTGMKLLHPFMPFITEEIYCTLRPEEETIVTASWPVYDPDRCFPDDERRIGLFKELVRGVRAIRQEREVPHSVRTEVVLLPKDAENAADLAILRDEITMERMLMASEVVIGTQPPEAESLTVVASGLTAYIPLAELVDVEKETQRLLGEQQKIRSEIARAEGMLSNEKFVAKAPAAKVEEERAKLVKYKNMLEQITAQLKAYGR